MRKLLRSKKALSPVVAAIILIAVTVAVSIAVAVWMGALTTGFMTGGEQLQLGNPWGWVLTPSTNDYVYVNCTNNGGSAIVLSTARIAGSPATITVEYHSSGTISSTLNPGDRAGLKITYTGKDFSAGVPYIITIVTLTNKEFQTQGTPPGP